MRHSSLVKWVSEGISLVSQLSEGEGKQEVTARKPLSNGASFNSVVSFSTLYDALYFHSYVKDCLGLNI